MALKGSRWLPLHGGQKWKKGKIIPPISFTRQKISNLQGYFSKTTFLAHKAQLFGFAIKQKCWGVK
jgi:hypothetical protein